MGGARAASADCCCDACDPCIACEGEMPDTIYVELGGDWLPTALLEGGDPVTGEYTGPCPPMLGVVAVERCALNCDGPTPDVCKYWGYAGTFDSCYDHGPPISVDFGVRVTIDTFTEEFFVELLYDLDGTESDPCLWTLYTSFRGSMGTGCTGSQVEWWDYPFTNDHCCYPGTAGVDADVTAYAEVSW